MIETKAKVFDLLLEKQNIYKDADKAMSEIQFNVEQRAAEIQKEIDNLVKLIEEEE
jgi:hypothetical protein